MSTSPVTLTPPPEPSTWAMMLVEFAGLGFAGYRRARAGRATLGGNLRTQAESRASLRLVLRVARSAASRS